MDHRAHVRQVLEIIQKNQLVVKLEKCQLPHQVVAYLGHVICEVDPNKGAGGK